VPLSVSPLCFPFRKLSQPSLAAASLGGESTRQNFLARLVASIEHEEENHGERWRQDRQSPVGGCLLIAEATVPQ